MIHLLESDVANLTPAHKRLLIDFLAFLHWSENPFRVVSDEFSPLAILAGLIPRRPLPGFLIDVLLAGCILRGAWEYSHLHGVAYTWLRLTFCYRMDPPPLLVPGTDQASKPLDRAQLESPES